MSAWDAKVAFGVRLASLYPIQLLLPGDSGVCFLPPFQWNFTNSEGKQKLFALMERIQEVDRDHGGSQCFAPVQR